jgi:hypothetical protein
MYLFGRKDWSVYCQYPGLLYLSEFFHTGNLLYFLPFYCLLDRQQKSIKKGGVYFSMRKSVAESVTNDVGAHL